MGFPAAKEPELAALVGQAPFKAMSPGPGPHFDRCGQDFDGVL